MIISRNRCIKVKVYIFKNQIEELKTKIKLMEEQLEYRRSSWIKKVFKR